MTDITANNARADKRAHAHVPGDAAMWIFIIGDFFIFSGWFMFYMLNRGQNTELFLASQQELDQLIGAINTLILLTSSWFIALSVQASREQRYQRASTYAFATLFCGLLFLCSKAYEWSHAAGAGHDPTANDFFAYYYFLTGIHLFHVIVGFVVLGVAIRELSIPSLRKQSVVETCATYWHMVDLLWVMIFAMLYLLR